jgi:hypothetical protein
MMLMSFYFKPYFMRNSVRPLKFYILPKYFLLILDIGFEIPNKFVVGYAVVRI